MDLDRVLKEDYEPSIRHALMGSGALLAMMPKPKPLTPAQKLQRRLDEFSRALNPHRWDRDCDCW